MGRKNMALRILLGLVATQIVSACTSPAPLPTATVSHPSPTFTHPVPTTPIPTSTSSHTAPSQPTPTLLSIGGGTYSFDAKAFSPWVITEKSAPIDILFPMDQLAPDEYVLYKLENGNDQEIWIISLDRKVNKKWIVCQNCPYDLELEASHKLDSSWEITGHAVGQAGGFFETLFAIDINHKQIKWINCRSYDVNTSCYTDFSPHGHWLYFYRDSTYDIHPAVFPPTLYLTSRDGEDAYLFSAPSVSSLPIAWAPDDSGYVITTGSKNCHNQYQYFLVDLIEKRIRDLSNFMCNIEPPNALFAGWSPDGKSIALVWLNSSISSFPYYQPYTRWSISTFYYWGKVNTLSVCPSSGLLSGDVSECKKIVEGLSKGLNGGETVNVYWLRNDQLLWVIESLDYGPFLDKIGIIYLRGESHLFETIPDTSLQTISPDRNWLIGSSHTSALGAYHLSPLEPNVNYLTTPGNRSSAVWIEVP